MAIYKPYAYLKTIDGEEVREYSKDSFLDLLPKLTTREVQRSDRKIFYIVDNVTANGIRFFKDDYFEIVDN